MNRCGAALHAAAPQAGVFGGQLPQIKAELVLMVRKPPGVRLPDACPVQRRNAGYPPFILGK
jgi:hypothetical protein